METPSQTTEQAAPPLDAEAQRTVRNPYEKCIAASKRVRWDIDRDVIRGRQFDFATTFLPDGLSLVNEISFLGPDDRRLMSQIQGRTYANIFRLVERFINAKVLDVSRDHWLGDQRALEALVRFCDEELKHQELFRRIEIMIGEGMPPGYRFPLEPNEIAAAVLSKSSWAVLALTCHIELFTLMHYRQSIEPNPDLSPLFKDIFLFHWKEESQHVLLDDLEWRREDAKLTAAQRDAAVDDFIALVAAVDGLLKVQSAADVAYFLEVCAGRYDDAHAESLRASVLGAYRWQYILSGAGQPRFRAMLASLISEEQGQRIVQALVPLQP